MSFGTRLSTLRKKKGWTQEELATRLNLSRSSVASYEIDTRTPEVDMLIKIADLFGVSTDYLTGRSLEFGLNDGSFHVDLAELLEATDREISVYGTDVSDSDRQLLKELIIKIVKK